LIEGAKVESQKEPKEVNRFVVDIGVCAVRALVDAMVVHEIVWGGGPCPAGGAA
jgi:hypothetical protein